MDHKLIISLHSESFRPSGMLIHRQNSYAPSGKQRTGRRGTQSREPVNNNNKLSVFLKLLGIRPTGQFQCRMNF
jgi:hypothetical protein